MIEKMIEELRNSKNIKLYTVEKFRTVSGGMYYNIQMSDQTKESYSGQYRLNFTEQKSAK